MQSEVTLQLLEVIGTIKASLESFLNNFDSFTDQVKSVGVLCAQDKLYKGPV